MAEKVLGCACGKKGIKPVVQGLLDKLETPDDSGGGAVVILDSTGVVTVHVVTLETPGKVLEAKLVVDPTANVDEKRVVDEAAGVQVPDTSHAVDEGAPATQVGGEADTAERVVLGHALSVEAASVDHQPDTREAGEGEIFKRGVPSFIALLVDDVRKLTVGNSAVDVSTGKQAVKLCRHRNGEQQQAQEGQHGGNGFRHEISSPALQAGKYAL